MNRLITTVLMGLVTINTMVMAQSARPKLVVGIVVDQLRTDYLEYLRDLFGEQGFKRLMKEGVYLRDVDFRQSVKDPAAATAVIYTGSAPAHNGIPSAEIYDKTLRRGIPVLTDSKVLGNYTGDTYSASPLLLSTIADEIAIDDLGLPAIYSIASDPQQAIIMSGHAGKGAAWIDDNTGKWASTSYYQDFPQNLAVLNRTTPLSAVLDTLVWRPLMSLDRYPGVPPGKKAVPFAYRFNKSDRDAYRKFKNSAPANAYVTDAAIGCLKSLRLGQRESIDMLNIGLTAAPYRGVRDGDYRLELEDTYLRLDAQIARILKEIDRAVGSGNALIYLTSTGYYNDAAADDPKYRIPTGTFSLKRAESLLNAYLSALYGNADFVDRLYGNQLYLNHATLEQKGLDLGEVSRKSLEFMLKMSGVAHVYTIADIISGAAPDTERLRLSTDARNCGDLIIEINPGWEIVDDNVFPSKTYPVRYGEMLTPAFILSPALTATEINTPIDARAIAPTVTGLLHIRSPNGASHRPIPLR